MSVEEPKGWEEQQLTYNCQICKLRAEADGNEKKRGQVKPSDAKRLHVMRSATQHSWTCTRTFSHRSLYERTRCRSWKSCKLRKR